MEINVDPALPPASSQQRDLQDLRDDDPDAYDYEYMVNTTTQYSSGADTLYSGVNAQFTVDKFKTSELILTKNGQILTEEEVQLILDNLELFDTRDTDGHYQYYYLVDDNENQNKRGGEVRAIPPALAELLERVGSIILTHINECTSVVVGGRVRLEEKGYWFMKRGNKIEFILNDYAEGQVPEIDALAGDTYFYFGAEINSPIVGTHWFSCAIDSHINFCWNNEIVFNIPEVIQEAGRWIWNETKLAFNYISKKIWSLFSRNTNQDSRMIEENLRDGGTIYYYKCPGFTFYPNIEEIKELEMEMEMETD